MGIEPTSSAWKAEVLPLNYARRYTGQNRSRHFPSPVGSLPSALHNQGQTREPGTSYRRSTTGNLVEGVGFEPTKA